MKRQRATAARQRERSEVATVALVGYTNAGKSTLLNRLADADLFVADMLFATLDPTSRRVTLPSGQRIVVTDTVGFINKLPHDLVDAFRATLEEVLRADLLIEVVDAADPDFVGQQEAVQAVLDELGAADKPRIVAFNKIDLLAPDLRAASMPAADRAVFVSATSGEGIDLLLGRVATLLREQMVRGGRRRALVARRAGGPRQGGGRRLRALHRCRRPPLRAPARTRSRPRCSARRPRPGDDPSAAARAADGDLGRWSTSPLSSSRAAARRIPAVFRDTPQYISSR